MSEATIKNLAIELAGMHYDFVRSHEHSDENLTARWPGGMVQEIDPLIFSHTYPTLKDFLTGRKHGRKVENYGAVSWEDTGQITMGRAGAYVLLRDCTANAGADAGPRGYSGRIARNRFMIPSWKTARSN